MKELRKKHAKKLRFALVGGFNTSLDFAILFLLTSLGIDKYIANFVSTTIAFCSSFFMNRSYTFKSSGDAKKQILPFIIVTLIGIWIIQPIVIWACTPLINHFHPSEGFVLFITKIIATGFSMVWNYLLYSRFVFKDSRETK